MNTKAQNEQLWSGAGYKKVVLCGEPLWALPLMGGLFRIYNYKRNGALGDYYGLYADKSNRFIARAEDPSCSADPRRHWLTDVALRNYTLKPVKNS